MTTILLLSLWFLTVVSISQPYRLSVTKDAINFIQFYQVSKEFWVERWQLRVLCRPRWSSHQGGWLFSCISWEDDPCGDEYPSCKTQVNIRRCSEQLLSMLCIVGAQERLDSWGDLKKDPRWRWKKQCLRVCEHSQEREVLQPFLWSLSWGREGLKGHLALVGCSLLSKVLHVHRLPICSSLR